MRVLRQVTQVSGGDSKPGQRAGGIERAAARRASLGAVAVVDLVDERLSTNDDQRTELGLNEERWAGWASRNGGRPKGYRTTSIVASRQSQ